MLCAKIQKKEVDIIFYEQALKEKTILQEKIITLQTQIEQLPDGHLLVAKNGKGFKWYHSDGHNKTYIPKRERKYVEKLALKKYLLLQKEHYEQELYAINQYLTNHNIHAEQIEHELINSIKFKEFLSSNSPTLSEKINNWINEEYVRYDGHPENLIHKAYSGNMVRSKSEVLIDMFLYKNQIPFRYEDSLILGNYVIHPDFTIMHPKTGEFVYWEHLGLMDDYSYVQYALSKIQSYIEHGIIPGQNLILTFETRNKPLSADVVEKIIKINFLD